MRTLNRFVEIVVQMVEDDHEGNDTEILQRATLNVAREAFKAGHLDPLLKFLSCSRLRPRTASELRRSAGNASPNC